MESTSNSNSGGPKKFSNLFSDKYKTPRRIFLIFVGAIFLFVVGFIIYAIQDLPPMHEIENPQSDLSTQLVSSDGVVLQRYYSRENRINLKLHEISPHVIDAFLATEDVRFYKHSGIDPKSFFSILSGYITGGIMRGGSTIDMQLARNLYGKEVKGQGTIIRKIKEFFVSAYIERRFTKREIMAAYLNTVNIYGTSYGIETTSDRLFNKSAKELTIEESAMLVGMLKGQGVYNPIKYPERTQTRRNLVIDQMVKYGFLDANTMNIDSLKAIPLNVVRQDQEHIKGLAPYFREHLRAELQKWCKENDYNLYTDGLRVFTTLDSRMQKHAEDAVAEHLKALQTDFDNTTFGKEDWRKDSASIANMMNSSKWNSFWKKQDDLLNDLKYQSARYQSGLRQKLSRDDIEKGFETPIKMNLFTWDGDVSMSISPIDSLKYYAGILETGFISIDPATGGVKAWVGGVDYRNFKYDHVAKGKRQVGSTFKPFVYATAIDNGYTPCNELLNQPVFFENTDGSGTRWAPKNSGGEVGGKMTLKRGLATSTNLITAGLMKEVGPHAVAEMAYRMGIKTQLDEVPSLALGTTDLSVLELTGAYCTFPNQGTSIEPTLISRIEDRYGNVLEEFTAKSQEALSPNKAFMMVELMRGVVDEPGGTAQRLRFRYNFDTEIGGKTGTTQNHSDGWFVGFVPNLSSGVWVGCADRRMRFRSIKYGQGANMALPIWALYMKRLYEDTAINFPKERFMVPDNFSGKLVCAPTYVEGDTIPKKKENAADGF
ncbi:MAG: transglycosylase domain-containing protein [Bacteroidota bacterium]